MEESDTKPVVPSSSDADPVPPPYCTVQPQQPQPQFQPQYQPQSQPQYQPPPNVMNNSTIVTTQPAKSTTTRVVGVADNMGLAIFSCMCCIWPLGLAAIIFASQSKNALARGDVSSAQAKGNTSLCLSLASIGFGVVIIIIMVILLSRCT